jgi:murein endopeptidase
MCDSLARHPPVRTRGLGHPVRVLLCSLALGAAAATAHARPVDAPPGPPVAAPAPSRAVGAPWDGRLRRGVQLPAEGPDWFTWDPVLKLRPNREWRRWGTDRLVATVLTVLAEYRAAHPEAARVGVGDLSRRHGGVFDSRFGGLGHVSHQNGLDVDVYYPRADGRERRAYRPDLVDPGPAQELVDRFVAAGAQKVFVGPRLDLHGPRGVVVPLVHHDDHLHVRIPPR